MMEGIFGLARALLIRPVEDAVSKLVACLIIGGLLLAALVLGVVALGLLLGHSYGSETALGLLTALFVVLALIAFGIFRIRHSTRRRHHRRPPAMLALPAPDGWHEPAETAGAVPPGLSTSLPLVLAGSAALAGFLMARRF